MNDRIARQRRIVAEHIRGENDKDWEAVYGTFVQDDRTHYQVVPLGNCVPRYRRSARFLPEHLSRLP